MIGPAEASAKREVRKIVARRPRILCCCPNERDVYEVLQRHAKFNTKRMTEVLEVTTE